MGGWRKPDRIITKARERRLRWRTILAEHLGQIPLLECVCAVHVVLVIGLEEPVEFLSPHEDRPTAGRYGAMRPIFPSTDSVNQRLPSGPLVIPAGTPLGMEHSVTTPAGVMRTIALSM